MQRSQGELLKAKMKMLNSLKETNEGQLYADMEELQKQMNSLLEGENTKWQ